MISSLQDLRLMVIADDPLARAGLAAILAAQAGCQIVGQAAGDSDWSAEIETAQPDVVVWDLGWTPAGPLDRLSDQRASLPPVLVLLPQHDAGSASAAQAWQAGARGLLPRNADPAVIAAAAHSLAQGLVVLDIELAADLLAVAPDRTTDSPVEQLTPREHEVLRLISKGEQFDIAVFDMLMPELDGIQLAAEARKTLAGTDLPIVLLTSISDVDTRIAARAQGFAAVLTKPVKLAELYEAVSSALGQTVQLQRRTKSRRSQQSQFANLAPVRRALRILLAEDNPINQKVAIRILSRLGHAPVVVENGKEALLTIHERDFDIILMDIHMPEMDGLEATRRIRADLPHARQPYIVALTADVMEGFQQRCLDAGMDAYVSKPVRIDELAAILQKVEAILGEQNLSTDS